MLRRLLPPRFRPIIRLQPLSTLSSTSRAIPRLPTNALSRLSYSQQVQSSVMREYGSVAVLVYLCFSFTFFCGCLTSITFLGIDETQILGWFKSIKTTLGFPPSESVESSKPPKPQWEWVPEWARNPTLVRVATNIALALVMTKLFVPVKLAMTAACTPFIATRLRGMGFELGSARFRDSIKHVKSVKPKDAKP